MRKQLLKLSAAASLFAVLLMPSVASAATASTVVVTPTNQQEWSSTAPLADTRSNGHVNFVDDSTAPLGSGALQLLTDTAPAANQDKAQYMHAAGVPFASITTLAYDTKQVSASFVAGLPSYQLATCLYGVTATDCTPSTTVGGKSFATFVYEPYVNVGNAGVQNNIWQHWDVSAGKFWSTKTEGAVQASQGTFTYTLAQLKTAFPNAVLASYGVNVGSNNPGYSTLVDKFVFNETTYDFEKTEPAPAPTVPTTKDQCKKDGYKNFVDDKGKSFKNQGQCIKYVQEHSTTVEGDVSYTAYSTMRRQAEFEFNTADNRGNFQYSDANHESYRVKISETKVDGHFAWFAGEVSDASNPANNGKWLFAKVENGNPDKIWGSFTDQTTAKNGVKNMTAPADGPFNIEHGQIKFKHED